jgi:hypothetical protein
MGFECFFRDTVEYRNKCDSIADEAKLGMSISCQIADDGVHARPHV